ncbi:MAG: alpha/beta hydrolase [Moraxellaceae bacterium]|jgi:pimeloyl-ACP methyl ester carboxylesterase|nr:alpha/beta hydrolase [Moraxellaceae bacterium]
MRSPATWRATPSAGYNGPRIVLVHGLAAGRHMERHLLAWLRELGYEDVTLYSNYLPTVVLARDVRSAVEAGRATALIGYSQGGFQVVKAARRLARQDIAVDLLVTLAAGGAGRFYFPQLGADPRHIPPNVRRCLNYYAEGDWLGTDVISRANLAVADARDTHVENIAYPRDARVDHVGIVRCYPPELVPPAVRVLFLERLQRELESLRPSP